VARVVLGLALGGGLALDGIAGVLLGVALGVLFAALAILGLAMRAASARRRLPRR